MLTPDRLWGIYLVTENKTQIDDLVHFTLREWSRLSYNVTEAETERAKAQLKASILLSLDGTTAVAEDIGRQIVTTGRRMNPEEVEKLVGQISEKDVMDFARRKLWDQDVAVSAVGSIEGSWCPPLQDKDWRSWLFASIPLVFFSLNLFQKSWCGLTFFLPIGLLDYNRIRNDMSRNA